MKKHLFGAAIESFLLPLLVAIIAGVLLLAIEYKTGFFVSLVSKDDYSEPRPIIASIPEFFWANGELVGVYRVGTTNIEVVIDEGYITNVSEIPQRVDFIIASLGVNEGVDVSEGKSKTVWNTINDSKRMVINRELAPGETYTFPSQTSFIVPLKDVNMSKEYWIVLTINHITLSEGKYVWGQIYFHSNGIDLSK